MALTFVHRDLALAGDRLERPSCAARSTAPGSSPPSRATGFSAGADVGFYAFLPIAASLLTIGTGSDLPRPRAPTTQMGLDQQPAYSRSMIVAMPCPNPMHIVCRP
jgi:hypothetical protein